MIDEDALSQATARAARAQSLLGDGLLSESYAKIEADLINAWITSAPRDVEGRELCWHRLQANRKHREYLESVLSDGKLAASQLRDLAQTAEREKRWQDVK